LGVIQLLSDGCNESSRVQPSDNPPDEFKTGLSPKYREKIGICECHCKWFAGV